MAQITAVDWLFTTLDNILELYPSEWSKVSKAVEEAKAMEKEQITHAWENGALPDLLKEHKNSRTYYNETYNKQHGTDIS
jgi:hypothetical protein